MSGVIGYTITEVRHVDFHERSLFETLADIEIGKKVHSYSEEELLKHLFDMSVYEYASIFPYNLVEDPDDDTASGIDIVREQKIHDELQLIITDRSNNSKAIARLRELRENPSYILFKTNIQQVKFNDDILTALSTKTQLSQNVVNCMLDYMRSMGDPKTRSHESILQDFLNIKKTWTREHAKVFVSIRNILSDSIRHLSQSEESCIMYHINVTHNGFEIGGIFVFHNNDTPVLMDGKLCVMIQDITKYAVPMLVQMMYPEFRPFIPKLNTELETPINIVAQTIEAKYVIVRPLVDQEKNIA